MSSSNTAAPLLANVARFARLLHDAGLAVPAGSTLAAAQALEFIDPGRRQDFYFTLRALLIHRAEDLAVFDQAFQLFWRAPRGERTRIDLSALGEQRKFGKPEIEMPSLRPDNPTGRNRETDPALPEPQRVQLSTYGDREQLRQKDFARLTAEELEQARALMASLSWEPGLRQSRRWQPARQGTPDLRRLIRLAGRRPDLAPPLPTRARQWKPRPLVLLCDVSGSMERYSRILIEFVHCLTGGFDHVEAFFFATRLTRITLELRRRSLRRALDGVARAVPDWSGGTRIGDALRQFHMQWARRVLGHGPVVMLISDGWDRGDPQRLAQEIARLQRSCHRLIWLNPLLASPEYQPLTRGLQAALPYVDDFLPVHNLASLESLAAHLNRLPPNRRHRGSL